MSWLSINLGNGKSGFVDLENPEDPPSVTVRGEVQTTQGYSVTGTTQKHTVTATPSTILSEDTDRKGFTIYNRAGTCLVLLGSGIVSEDLLTTRLTPNTFFECSFRGIVSVIAETETSTIFVTQLI